MPRFPALPHRVSVPAVSSTLPRDLGVDYGAGPGHSLPSLESDVANFGQTIDPRRNRQVKQVLSRFDLDLAKRRAQSDAQAPPGENSEARMQRHRAIFDVRAETLLRSYEGQALQKRLIEAIETRRAAQTQKLLADEARNRLGKALTDTQGLVDDWSVRVASDPAEFNAALRELLGNEASGETGLLNGLGLRSEALAVWRHYTVNKMLDARVDGDPAGLIEDLDTARWRDELSDERRRQLLGEARESLKRITSLEMRDRIRQGARSSLELSQSITQGTVGASDIRRAEEAGTLSAPQAEALRAELKQAETTRRAGEQATTELTIALIAGEGFDSVSPENRKAAEAFYETTFRDAVRSGTDLETEERIADALAKTGYIPKGLVRDLSGELLSHDEDGRVQAAKLYGRLRDVVPEQMEEAFDLELQARAGILHGLLEIGLPEAEALIRAEAIASRDGRIESLGAEEVAVLQRALREGFGDGAAGHVSGVLLDQLHEKYLIDLAGGYTPRQARVRLERNVASALIRLEGFKWKLARMGFAVEKKNGRLAAVQTEPRVHKAEAATLSVVAIATGLVIGAALVYSIDNAEAMGLDVSEDIRDLRDWVNEQSWEVKEALFFEFPNAAPLMGLSVVDVPGDQKYLGEIVGEDETQGLRLVEIYGAGFFRKMTVLQHWDPARDTYADQTGRYPDRKGNPVFIDLKTGRVIPPEELERFLNPPLEPQPGTRFEPGGFGEGVDLERFFSIGGEPPDNSLLTGQAEGLVPPAGIGDRLPGYPDQSDIVNGPGLAASESNEQQGKLKIEEGKQGKHIVGHNNFRPGSSEVTHPDLQTLIDKFAGTGQAVNNVPRSQPGFKERVDFEVIIGNFVDIRDNTNTPTTIGIVHYARNGVHIVPARPKE